MHVARTLSLRNVLRSPLLMVASLCSILACLVLLLCIIAPFWFTTISDVTYPHSNVPRSVTEHIGLTGYVDYNGRWHNLNMLDKATNSHPVPLMFRAAQVFGLTGFIVAAVASAAITLLALKPYRHFVAEISTLVALLYAVIANVLTIALSMACIGSKHRHIWPERTYMISHAQWAAFLAILGTAVLIAALVAMVLETAKSFLTVERIRGKPKRLLEDEPLYYKFDYRKIPKVAVVPNPILRHVYTNPAALRSATPLAYHASTPSAYSAFSYNTQPGVQPLPGYAPPGYVVSPAAYGSSYGDSDMDRSSYNVSVDDQGRRMVSM